ncbi:hypothetical protein EYF80_054244 [Liparis tanakae]|uniref:Uncharacterized protein n=1 Tax=Liparis tanakae TaxID=230148 RepID=A0A4Z2F3W3_9TELE|nr:hypothetical protein EYF80_054244 [Liparis tanakae]
MDAAHECSASAIMIRSVAALSGSSKVCHGAALLWRALAGTRAAPGQRRRSAEWITKRLNESGRRQERNVLFIRRGAGAEQVGTGRGSWQREGICRIPTTPRPCGDSAHC